MYFGLLMFFGLKGNIAKCDVKDTTAFCGVIIISKNFNRREP